MAPRRRRLLALLALLAVLGGAGLLAWREGRAAPADTARAGPASENGAAARPGNRAAAPAPGEARRGAGSDGGAAAPRSEDRRGAASDGAAPTRRRPRGFHPPPLRVDAPLLRLGGGPRGGLLLDLDSGRVLWSRAAGTPRPLASLVKVMTALVVVDAAAPNERVRISRAAAGVRGSDAALVAGRRARVEALLHGLLLPSGNDAAVALAEHVAGSQRAFVARMNRRARAWGLRCTRFVSVHGLGRRNRSCPRDLAELVQRALHAPRIARIVRRRTARVDLGARRPRTLTTTNPLLRGRYRGTLGLKTGWTPSAGRCLLAVVRRGGRRYGVVVLDDREPARTVRRLIARAT